MSCIDAATWNKANTDCQNLRQSVKGFGYVATGPRALRGLGADVTLNVSPSTYDPCAIAAQQSCASQPKPPGFKAATTVKAQTPPGIVAAGFSHWGLLAAVVVGGVVVYKVATRKSS